MRYFKRTRDKDVVKIEKFHKGLRNGNKEGWRVYRNIYGDWVYCYGINTIPSTWEELPEEEVFLEEL